MSARSGKVLISGGGITGLTAACALRHHGVEVELVEVKPTLSDDGGVGLTLVGNALLALDSIGLAQPLIDVGMPGNHLTLCNPQGVRLQEQPTVSPAGKGLPGHCSISRGNLHRVLAEAAQSRGARIRTGVEIERSVMAGDGIDVTFSDGSTGHYALCAAAEGLFSKSRERLFPQAKPQHSGQGSWRALVRRPEGLLTSEIYLGGPFGVVGICPITQEDAYLYIVETAQASHWEDPERTHLRLREKLQGVYGGQVAPLLEQLDDPRKAAYRPLPTFILPAPWHRERTLLIGDAAHANPPVLAQGAAMGIEDAVVLAEEWAARPEASVEQVLDAVMARRFPRARQVVDDSTQLARWQTEGGATGEDVARVMTRVSQMLAQPY